MAITPTVSELFEAKAVADDEVNAAVDVRMRDSTVSLFRFASGHTLDQAVAVEAHEPQLRLTIRNRNAFSEVSCIHSVSAVHQVDEGL